MQRLVLNSFNDQWMLNAFGNDQSLVNQMHDEFNIHFHIAGNTFPFWNSLRSSLIFLNNSPSMKAVWKWGLLLVHDENRLLVKIIPDRFSFFRSIPKTSHRSSESPWNGFERLYRQNFMNLYRRYQPLVLTQMPFAIKNLGIWELTNECWDNKCERDSTSTHCCSNSCCCYRNFFSFNNSLSLSLHSCQGTHFHYEPSASLLPIINDDADDEFPIHRLFSKGPSDRTAVNHQPLSTGQLSFFYW